MRFDECLEVLLKAWTANEPFSHRGKYWEFDDIVVEPPPAQKPHPQIWMGAGSERSIRRVAAQGFNLLLGQYASLASVASHIAAYKSEVEARGRRFDPMQVGVTRAFFVTDAAEERQAALERRLQNRVRQLKLATWPDGRCSAARIAPPEIPEPSMRTARCTALPTTSRRGSRSSATPASATC